jgi:hypothetical protein
MGPSSRVSGGVGEGLKGGWLKTGQRALFIGVGSGAARSRGVDTTSKIIFLKFFRFLY